MIILFLAFVNSISRNLKALANPESHLRSLILNHFRTALTLL